MRSARGAAFSSSAARFQSASDQESSNGFQMPTYTSHTSRSSPTRKRLANQQTRARSPREDDVDGSHRCSESDQNLLAMLNSTVACLKEKQMDIEALGCLEQSLWLKRRMFGIESPTVHKALHEVVLSYNSIAMQFLALGQFDQCLSMLRKAEAITAPPGNFKNCQSLQILTFNNIGCCYRKLGKLKSALKYLKEAAQIGAGCAHVKNLSITHLNLCAIQSQLGRHDLALEHAQAAIFHTQEELVSLDGVGADGERTGEDVLDAKSREEKIVSLAVAYHNLAVELEFNDRGEASLQWYKKALQLVARFRDSNQALCDSFEKIFLDAKRKYQGSQKAQPLQAPIANQNRAARPKSAHPASSRNGAKASAPTMTTASRNVSYSATVASQCYKPTKPSAAGLHFTCTSPGKPGIRNTTTAAPQRPSSATSSRRRPLSASSSSRPPPSDHPVDDSIERRWKQIEQEIFGSRNVQVDTTDECASRSGGSASQARPQSARNIRAAAQNRSHSEHGRIRNTARTQASYADAQFIEDDECGIVQDDDDDDEAESQFQEAHKPPISRGSVPDGSASGPSAGNAREVNGRHANLARPRSHRAARGERPTRAKSRPSLNDFKHRESTRSDVSTIRTDQECDYEDHSSTGYAGGEEDFASLSESSSSSDVPQQRVSHLEYLRRMKKLSDTIQEDLSGKTPTSTSRTGGDARKSEPSMMPRTQVHRPRTAKASEGIRSSDKDEVKPSTPRTSSSKVRERLELVRRDSVTSFDVADDGDEYSPTSRGSSTSLANASTILVTEEVNVFANDSATLGAERELLQHASARRIQSAARGSVACRRFEAVRRQKELEREMQMQAKRASIEARELELQAQRIARLAAKGDQAARVIQNACRRELAREAQLQSKRVLIEAKELELQTQRELRQTQRHQEAAGMAQDMLDQPLQAQDAFSDEHHDVDDGDRSLPSPDDQEVEQVDLRDREGPYDEPDDNESHYTPLASSRSSTSHRLTEPSTNPSQSSTARSNERGDAVIDALLSARDFATPRESLPSSGSSSLTPTPRNSVQLPTPRQPDLSSRAIYTPRLSASSPPGSGRLGFDAQQDAALRIQCAFRKHRASEYAAVRYARRLSRSYIERHHMSLVLTQAEAKELAFLEELCAIKIQAVVRGRQARFLYEAMVIGRHAAANAIQTNFRRHRSYLQRSTAHGVESIAARNIQRKYRAYASRRARRQQMKLYEEALEVHHIAAQTLQRRWRSWSQRHEQRVEEWEAATCIQALGRGHLVRKSYQSLKESASRSSAFSIDADAAVEEGINSRVSSRARINEEADDDGYEEAFDDEDLEKPPSPIVGPSQSKNVSFLPVGVRELYLRYAAALDVLPDLPKTPPAVVDEMLNAGYGLDEMAQELETCPDVDSAVTLLDTMIALVETRKDKFRTLPHLVRFANAVERRIHEDAWWNSTIEARIATFVMLFQELLQMD